MNKEQAIEKLNDIRCHVKETSAEEQALVMAIDALKAQHSSEGTTKDATSDLISRQAAIDALWKALYEYEDKTEKQFLESEELDVADWVQHRIFVQNMNDIDRRTLLELPSAQPEPQEGHWIDKGDDGDWAWQIDGRGNSWHVWGCSECEKSVFAKSSYCPNCGAKMKGAQNG